MEVVNDDTHRLSEHMGNLISTVSLGARAGFPDLAQDLRETRHLLERNCGLIDQILEFIGLHEADAEDPEDLDTEGEGAETGADGLGQRE